MRLLVALMVLTTASPAATDEINSCQDLIPKGSKLVVTRSEPIEGGVRCYVRHPDSDEESYQGVVWDKPTAGPKEDHGCPVNEPFLLQLWEANLDARHAAAVAALDKKIAAGKAKKGDKPVDMAARTFAIAAVFDEQCRHQKNVQGAFESSGPHAEQHVMKQLLDNKELRPGYSLAWMIDQEPCRAPDTKPKEGYCTVALKDFALKQQVASRVFVVGKVDPKQKTKGLQPVASAKTFATKAYEMRETPAKLQYWPKTENYIELDEFRVKHKSKK
jgi:hypothetical protein